VNNYLDDYGAWENKNISDIGKERGDQLWGKKESLGTISLRKLNKENGSIQRMRENRRKLQAERENLRSGLQKGEG
jgi:hypothetical protein